MGKVKEYYHDQICEQDNEVLPPDYMKWLDAQEPAWKSLDKDSEAQKELIKLTENCF